MTIGNRHPALVAFDNCDGSNRAKAMLGLYGLTHVVSRQEWFALFGRGWGGCSDIGRYRESFAEILNSATRDELDLMMTPDEREAWKRLPAMLTVYRGCYCAAGKGISSVAFTERGLSWTLAPYVAARFASVYEGFPATHTPLILTGCVSKARTVHKRPHSSMEIIATNVSVVRTDALA